MVALRMTALISSIVMLGNLFLRIICAVFVVIDLRLHGHQVDNTGEITLGADGQLNRHSVTFESILHHLNNMVKICAHDVHLVNVNHSRNVVVVGLTPNSLRLRLNAALCTENRDRTVEHAQRTLDLNGEVNVSGGVDDVDSVLFILMLAAFPESSCRSRGNEYRIRSVVVVLPASMCAMIPIFLVCSSDTCLGIIPPKIYGSNLWVARNPARKMLLHIVPRQRN